VLFDLEAHGRDLTDDTVDVSRTVGWFTAIQPVLLPAEPDAASLIPKVVERLSWVRAQELNYGLARYLSSDEALVAAFEGVPRAQISFLYLGALDQLAGHEGELTLRLAPVGPPRSPRARRIHVIEFDGAVVDGCLQVNWTYSQNLHREATIEALRDDFLSSLRDMLDDGGVPERPAAAARFGWSKHDVGDILAEIERLRE